MTRPHLSAVRSRRAVGLVLASGLMATLTACSGWSLDVPTSGPIQQGERIVGGEAGQFIRVIARPPVDGMSPAQIVQGFLDASASFDGNHAVARQYLTPPASADWDSRAGVVVYDGVLGLTSTVTSTVTARGVMSGTIGRDGRYQVEQPGREVVAEFGLVQIDGQWRLNQVPAGLILSRADVDRAFRTYDLYFYDPDFGRLLPDTRILPVLGPGTATTLMTRLLAGPSDWLAPAVRSAIPDGTTLAITSVPIESGVAKVDLSPGVRALASGPLAALAAQIAATLAQVPEVTAVQLSAGGTRLVIPGLPSVLRVDSQLLVGTEMEVPGTAYALVDSGIARLSATGSLQTVALRGTSPRLRSLAVYGDAARLAGVDGRGRLWLRPEAGAFEPIPVGAVAGAEVDGAGTLWAVTRQGRILTVGPDGAVSRVTVSDLPVGSRIARIALAPDGVRLAAVVLVDGGSTLLVGRITRGVDGLVTLSAFARAEQQLSNVVDVAWESERSLLTLATDGARPIQAVSVSLPRGEVRVLGGPAAAESIAASPGAPPLIGTSDGVLFESVFGVWRERVVGREPVYANG